MSFNFGNGPDISVVKPMGKFFYGVDVPRGKKAFATVTQRGKDRDLPAVNVFHVYFVAQALFSPKNKRRAGNVFKPGVSDPKFVHPSGFDFYRGWHVPEVRTNERQSGFVF